MNQEDTETQLRLLLVAFERMNREHAAVMKDECNAWLATARASGLDIPDLEAKIAMALQRFPLSPAQVTRAARAVWAVLQEGARP